MKKLVDSLTQDMHALARVGAVSKTTLRRFEAANVPEIDGFGPERVKALREALHISQPVFAMYLHTTASTVRKWEQGATHPTGPALVLLNMIERKGLAVLI